jgi:hypothetical protein
MFDTLDDSNFILYAAKHYDNPQCYDMEEFYDDLKRFKYIKRLFGKYHDTGEIRENLILNHIVVLYNVFGEAATRMLFFKLVGYYSYLKPFLIVIDRMPDTLRGIGFSTGIIHGSDIVSDNTITTLLQERIRKS